MFIPAFSSFLVHTRLQLKSNISWRILSLLKFKGVEMSVLCILDEWKNMVQIKVGTTDN